MAWLSEFDLSTWPQEARSAAVDLGEVSELGRRCLFSVTVEAPAPGDAKWRDVAWMNGPYGGYRRYNETGITLRFGAGTFILDFAFFDRRDPADEKDEPHLLMLKLVFADFRFTVALPDD